MVVGEAMRQGGTCRGGRLPIIWGGRIERRKNKNDRAKGPALPWVDESKATIKVKSDNCELRVKIKII